MQTTYQVTGMTCSHCERAIREEVAAISDISNVDVSAESGVLTITSSAPLDDAAVIAAVDEAGYQAVRA